MVPVSRARRPLRGFALLLLCLSLLALLPNQPVAAQSSTVAETLDNSQSNFSDGVFQRTSIGPESRTDITPAAGEVTDEEGVIQLAPSGILLPWSKMSQELPVALTQAGVTTLNGRLYVIGGLRSGGVLSSAAYWATVEPTTGSLVDSGSGPWTNTPLPATTMILDNDPSIPANYPACSSTTNPARTRPGVASVAKDASTGYIYVVGGEIDVTGCRNFSTAVVQRGAVAANGTITWTTLPATMAVPSPTAPLDDGDEISRLLGVDGAATVIARSRSGATDRYFLYVIGGKSRYINGNADTIGGVPEDAYERVLRTVYYTEIDMATGNLKSPVGDTNNVWKRDADIDLVVPPLDNQGLWDATATASEALVGTQLKSAIFLAGGLFDLGTDLSVNLNPYVYRADVGTNGALTWASSTNTVGPNQVTLGARRGMASITYNSKLYLIGGRTNNTDGSGLDSIPTSFFDDSLNLIKPDPGLSDFFIGTSDKVLQTDSVIDPGRYNLGAAVVRAEPPDGAIVGTLNSAWAYAIGGTTSNAGAPTSTIFRGKIGGDDASSIRRAPDGWYYSNVFKTSFSVSGSNKLARLVAIHWATDIDRTANPNSDIQIEFRKTITGSGECEADGSDFSTTEASDAWRGPIDGFTNNALFYSRTVANGAMYNVVNMSDIFPNEKINASCIQYRAHFLQNVAGGGATTASNSPKLLSIYIEKVTAGNADINVADGGFDVVTVNNRLSSLKINIQNRNIDDPTQTLTVNEALSASKLPTNGSFFVNLCIARSNLDQAPPTLSIPSPSANFTGTGSNTTTCPYYAEVFSAEMGNGTILDLTKSTVPTAHGGGSRWWSNATGQAVTDISTAFSQLGHYQVGLVLDTVASIPEGAVGEANNRVETTGFPNGTTISFTIEGTPLTVLSLPLLRR